jgi:2-oxoglutarate ferredoxin oxidoreductase subunit beta
MKSSTSPNGRTIPLNGNPLDITKLLAQLDGTCYVTRQSVHNVATVRRAKKAIQKAFENSMQNKGTSVVEIVSTCNSGWKLSPADSNDWMVNNMFPAFPLGDLKDL